MTAPLVGLQRRLQIDRTLGFALAARLWQAFSGPLTIYLVVSTLSIDQQSVYYGIASVLAIQSLFELGTGNVIIGQAGYLADRRAAVGMLAVAADRWFRWLAIGFAGLALPTGWWLFARAGLPESLGWPILLLGTVLCAGISVSVSGRIAVLEGAGFRQRVYGVRLLMAVVGSLAVWTVLISGGGLGCLLAAGGVQSLALGCLAFSPSSRRLAAADGVSTPDSAAKPLACSGMACSGMASSGMASDFSWQRDVLPSQWRMALISLAYHLATQLFPLFLLAVGRPGDAARMGMTLAITSAIQMLALAWVQTRFPLAARLHGQGQRAAAAEMWRQTAAISLLLLIAALALAIGLVHWLPRWDERFEGRLLAGWQVGWIAAGCVANHLVALVAFYLLAGRRSPIVATVPAYLLTAAVTATAAWWGGASGLVVGYALCFWGVVLPVQIWGYRRLQRQPSG